MKTRKIWRTILTMLFIITIPVHASAKWNSESVETEPLQIPSEMDFVFHENCSGHDYFYHVAFREDGWFAVFYRTASSKLHEEEYLSRIYVDIFNDRGEFQKEVSFKSEYDIALELTETLNIYCYDCVIAYDWESDGLEIERIPKDFAHTSGIYADFTQKDVNIGNWSYTCERTMMGYCTIKRTNGEQEEVLLSLSGDVPGMHISLESVVISIVVGTLFMAAIGVTLIITLRKRKKHTMN